MLCDPGGEFGAIHTRHGKVDNGDVEVLRVELDQGAGAITRLDHMMAMAFQGARDDGPHAVIVIHEQYAHRVPLRSRRKRGRGRRGEGLPGRAGE